MTRGTVGLLVFTTLCLAADAAAASAPKVSVRSLRDGTTLVFARTPGAPVGAFRYLVDSGGTADPPERAGLAHILEHLIFHGSVEVDGDAVLRAVHESGGYSNAFTTADSTWYVLDAPIGRFAELVALQMKTLTNPALTLARLKSEQGVIATEHVSRSGFSMLWLADRFVFPSGLSNDSVIGSHRSRLAVQREDLAAYYAAHYVPRNTTIFIAADLDVEDITAMLEGATRLAPSDEAAPRAASRTSNLPSRNQIIAPISATLVGYAVEDRHRSSCSDLASLLELRLRDAVGVERVDSSLQVFCGSLREQTFLVVLFGSQLLARPTAELVESVTADVRERPMTGAERAIVRVRDERALRARNADPRLLVEALLRVAQNERNRSRREYREVLRVRNPSPNRLRMVAREVLVPQGRFVLEVKDR